jgi:VanZ family protein
MQKRIKNLLERNALSIAISFTLLIAYLSLKTIHFESPINITFLDKILHFSAYFVLTLSWLFALRLSNKKYLVLISLLLYGILIEFLQGWLTLNRTKDFYDVIANGFGIIFAALLYKYFYKFYLKIFG